VSLKKQMKISLHPSFRLCGKDVSLTYKYREGGLVWGSQVEESYIQTPHFLGRDTCVTEIIFNCHTKKQTDQYLIAQNLKLL
jgi:hypothetical protein